MGRRALKDGFAHEIGSIAHGVFNNQNAMNAMNSWSIEYQIDLHSLHYYARAILGITIQSYQPIILLFLPLILTSSNFFKTAYAPLKLFP
jgi:hypothetical protein